MPRPATTRPSRRLLRILATGAVLVIASAWLLWGWKPGLDVRDGRHDRGRNGLWLAHGWMGADEWFIRNGKTNQYPRYRHPDSLVALAERLRRHHITDVFPHLCPADPTGHLPPWDPAQTERFLDALPGVRVIPWIGGPLGSSARIHKPEWRTAYVRDVRRLLDSHPRLAGVQVNVEPLTSGDTYFLTFLDELRAALPTNRMLSIAAYPPPTRWQPSLEVHWEQPFFRQVATRSDQMVVMMYDVGQRLPKAYEQLMAAWTREVLAWSEGKPVLLGLPAYDDADTGYHDPRVENLQTALHGVHRGLSSGPLPAHYQGVALYSDWEIDEAEWSLFREQFLSPASAIAPSPVR